MASNQFPSTLVGEANHQPSSVSSEEVPATPPPNVVATTPTSTLKNGSSSADGGTTTKATTATDEENRYFYEDEVFRYDANGRVRFGLVMETFDASNSDTEMTQSDMEEQLKKGEVRVVWHPRGVELVMPEAMVRQFSIFF